MIAWRLTELSYQRTGTPTQLKPLDWTGRTLAQVNHDRIMASACMVSYITAGGWPRWIKFFRDEPQEAYVSGDRLLLLTNSLVYDEWGILGPALLLDIANGKQIAKLRGDRAAGTGDGRFILGLEGYDFFDSWLYNRDGTIIDQWRSYGHYIVDLDGVIRVVECDRSTPTSSRIVRLRPNGVIEAGPHLTTGQVPRPAELPDGTIIVLDCGKLRAIDRGLNDTVLAELLTISPREAWRFQGKLAVMNAKLQVSIEERIEDSTGEYMTHRWEFAVESA